MPPKMPQPKMKADDDLTSPPPPPGGDAGAKNDPDTPARPVRLANAQFFIDDDPLSELDHLTHARSLLSQVCGLRKY
jgi:hypothetical protein